MDGRSRGVGLRSLSLSIRKDRMFRQVSGTKDHIQRCSKAVLQRLSGFETKGGCQILQHYVGVEVEAASTNKYQDAG